MDKRHLWISRVQWRRSSISKEQKKSLRLDTLKRSKGAVLLYACHFPQGAQTAKRDLVGPWISAKEKLRTWVSPGFPTCACPCHLFPAHPLYCFTRCTTEGQWVAGRTVSWAMSETLWRNADPSNCFTGAIRKAAHEPLELLHPQIIPASPWVPPTLHIPHSHHCSPTHPKLAPHVHP